jgi:hypothetical protein
MKRFPRGSEWRKWDLHIHPPGTKLNDGYEPKDGQPDWGKSWGRPLEYWLITDCDYSIEILCDEKPA